MNRNYDPHRAHPDTVLALTQWLLDGGFTGPMSNALPELLAALREECRIDLDGELLRAAKAYFRTFVPPGSAMSGAEVKAAWDLLERRGRAAVSVPEDPPAVVAPAPNCGPAGAAAKESREDNAAPGGATSIEVTCQRCGKTLSELGLTLGQAEAHYHGCRGGEVHPDACGCEQSEALEKQLAALRSRNFDLSTHLARVRRLAQRPEVLELFEELDREP